ncbi:uncharacterized protein [Henckelia pumila]|uniref:uncharacterized protein n=1 Tax=Henckelia pumila TaxID=405737 RepID=UPI003C6E4FC9
MKIRIVNTVESISGGEPQMVEKPRAEWTNEDKKKSNLDNVSKDILYKTLDKNMFSMIKTCSTAKEIWEKLTQLCERNDQTKENKLTLAIQMFDNAKIKSGETMDEFDERFSKIICYASTPREWDVKTIAMRESKDLNKLELHDLFTDLKAYEFELGIRTDEEPSFSNPTKALTSTVSPQLTEEASAKKTAEQMSGKAMSLFIKRFGKFMRNNKTKFKPYYKQDHTEDGPACFNCGKQGHFIADCTKPKNEEKKQHYEKKKGKEGIRTFRKKKEQRVLVADEGKSKWAETESDSSDTDSSSEESDEEQVQCLMANSQHEEDNTEIFDFNSSDFAQEELIQALNDMVTEYKNLSTSFEEEKTEKPCLIDKSRESGCLHQKELDGLRTKLNLLAAENDDMKRVFQDTLYENQKLLKTINSWNNASTSLDKIHENQKQVGDKIGLGYGSNECIVTKENTQSYCSGNDPNVIRFVRNSTIYEHAEPKIYDEQSSRYESKGKHKGLGYVEPKIQRKGETWSKTRLNEQIMGKQSKFKQSRFEPSQPKYMNHRMTQNQYFNCMPVQKRYRLVNKDQKFKQYTGKQVRDTFKTKGFISSSKCLDLLHMDLFGPIPGIKHELSAARAPQQNGVAERRNRILKEEARTMIADSNVSQRLWAEAINTAYKPLADIKDLANRLESNVLDDESDSDEPPVTRNEPVKEIVQPNEGRMDQDHDE